MIPQGLSGSSAEFGGIRPARGPPYGHAPKTITRKAPPGGNAHARRTRLRSPRANVWLMTELLLWLHIGFAIFTLGPITAATMSTPRFIRTKDVNVLRYLHKTTRIYGIAAIGVFLFGLVLGREFLGKPYLSVSMTLFIVAAVLLVIVDRDQATAIRVLGTETPDDDAKMQTGRIAALSGVVALIWLVILVLMVWGNPA